MPRASFGDKCTVAVQRKNKQSVFDCSSKVLDVLTLDTTANGDAHTLIILCEEGVCESVCARSYVCTELIAIDLLSAAWLPLQLPYLRALHTSPISACTHVPNVNASVVEQLIRAHDAETATKYSQRAWPIQGGFVVGKTVDNDCQQLLITGLVLSVKYVCTMYVSDMRTAMYAFGRQAVCACDSYTRCSRHNCMTPTLIRTRPR